jgi:hypothetical protein
MEPFFFLKNNLELAETQLQNLEKKNKKKSLQKPTKH